MVINQLFSRLDLPSSPHPLYSILINDFDMMQNDGNVQFLQTLCVRRLLEFERLNCVKGKNYCIAG